MNLILKFFILLGTTGYFFVEPENKFSVLLPDEIELVKLDTLENNFVNYTFAGKNIEYDFDYSLSLVVVESENENLLDDSTITIFEEGCNCIVTEVVKVEYRNFRGVKYFVRKNVGEVSLEGVVIISQGKNGKSINAVSLVLEGNSEHIPSTINPILETLVLNF